MLEADQPETWLDLERAAQRIYAELEPECLVRHNVLLPGLVTGIDRQIDVLIEHPALDTRVVVDCKDWKRPVDVNDAAAFAFVLEDVRATRGVLICNAGFTPAAGRVAQARGFVFCRLHDGVYAKLPDAGCAGGVVTGTLLG